MSGAAGAGARLAVGVFTVVPVRVERADRAAARWAMLWAPALGALAGALTGAVAAAGTAAGLPAALAALLGVGAAALFTRGLHLDGLADLADGLGSARPAAGALEVMRRSDIGPFGVITLVFVLGAQVLALARLAEASPWAALAGAVAAGAAGRTAITWACTPGVPAARPEGLGAMVAGTVPAAGAAAATAAVLAGCSLGLLVSPGFAAACAASLAAGLAGAALLRRRAVRRLGGVTGDVMGALAETGATVALVVLAGSVAWL